MTINLSYKRVAPDGRTITITPKNQAQLEYYRSLEAHGYKYEPVVQVYQTSNLCLACEG